MQLIGRLVADPETRTTRNGKDYAKYTIATNDPLGPPGENGQRPEETSSSFHNIFAFGDNAVERIMRLTKGCVVENSTRLIYDIAKETFFLLHTHRTQVFVEADFKVQYNPSESGEGGKTDYLAQHRFIQVISRPKPAGESA